MPKITITPDAVKLFTYLLNFYLKHEDQRHSDLDSLWSSVFGMKSKLIHSSFNQEIISEAEKEKEYAEIDAEISAWDNKLRSWQSKRFYLDQYLNLLRQQLKEVSHALTS